MSDTTLPPIPTSRRVAVFAATALVTLVFLAMVNGYLDVLFLAALLAAMARPLQKWNVRILNGRNGWAAALTLIGMVLPALATIFFLTLVVFEQGQSLVEAGKPLLQDLQDPQRGTERIQALLSTIPGAQHFDVSPKTIRKFLAENAGELFNFVKDSISAGIKSVGAFSGVIGWWLLKLFVMLYATFFFLKEGPKIRAALTQTVPLPADIKQRLVAKGISVVRATLRGTLVIGVLQGALAGVAFAVAGVEGSVFFGVAAVFASLVPTVGTAVIWVPMVLYFLLSGQMVTAIGLLLWCGLVVGLVDNILRPRLVGNDTKMPDLLILVSTLGGAGMFGPIGILLGPALAGVCVLMWDVFQQTFGETYSSSQSDASEIPPATPESIGGAT